VNKLSTVSFLLSYIASDSHINLLKVEDLGEGTFRYYGTPAFKKERCCGIDFDEPVVGA
jgi:hypothetical protein